MIDYIALLFISSELLCELYCNYYVVDELLHKLVH